MKLSCLILALLVFSLYGCKEEYQAGRLRLVEETVYTYGWTNDGEPKIGSVSQYKYRKDSSGRRTYDYPRVACDSFYHYSYGANGEVNLTRKEIRSYNNNGLEDTSWQFAPAANGMQLVGLNVTTYINDTTPSVSYMYVNTVALEDDSYVGDDIEELTDTIATKPNFVLTAKQILKYTGDELVSRTFYGTYNDQDCVLVKMKEDIFKDNRLSLTEDYTVTLYPATKKTAFRREKRYVYDSTGNELSSNTYIVYDDGTEELWDKDKKTYNDNGQLIAHSYSMHLGGITMEQIIKYTYTKSGATETVLSINKSKNEPDRIEEVKYTYNTAGKVVAEETVNFKDTTLKEVISKKRVETSYNTFGEKEEMCLYTINENGPKGARKILLDKTTYTYEAY